MVAAQFWLVFFYPDYAVACSISGVTDWLKTTITPQARLKPG